MNVRILILVLLFSYFHPAQAQTLSFEQDVVSEGELQVQLNDFTFESTNKDFTVSVIRESLKWRRNELQHLNPFLKIQIRSQLDPKTHILKFRDQLYTSSQSENSSSVYMVEYNLFQPQPISIHNSSNAVVLAMIIPNIRSASIAQPILIDHSCFPQNLSVQFTSKTKPVYLTTRCQLDSYGKQGEETSVLTVSIQSPQLRFSTESISKDSIQLRLHHSEKSLIQAIDEKGHVYQLEVAAKVPKRFHRLKTALGFGPYIYQTKDVAKSSEQSVTPSYMLYGKYDLTGLSSIKFFDALIATETVFNNSGVYFSYDLASALDQMLIVNALLGVQGIHYRFPGDSNIDFTTTAPQGFEIVYKHPFGMENYNFMYGGFFSTNPSEPYINTWIRFGKGYFWELNYIKWEHEQKQISMFGLSIGIPFMQFF